MSADDPPHQALVGEQQWCGHDPRHGNRARDRDRRQVERGRCPQRVAALVPVGDAVRRRERDRRIRDERGCDDGAHERGARRERGRVAPDRSHERQDRERRGDRAHRGEPGRAGSEQRDEPDPPTQPEERDRDDARRVGPCLDRA